MAKSMMLSQHPSQPAVESSDEDYDEDEAKHRFESAVRGARRAHDQRLRAPQAAEKEHASSRRYLHGKL
jgi:hypothetical protein